MKILKHAFLSNHVWVFINEASVSCFCEIGKKGDFSDSETQIIVLEVHKTI